MTDEETTNSERPAGLILLIYSVPEFGFLLWAFLTGDTSSGRDVSIVATVTLELFF